MRPCRSTWVASTTKSPAPEFESPPRCVMCQSLPTPSSALYWHIGDTTMRFESVRSASFMGENKALGIDAHMMFEKGKKHERAASERNRHTPCVRFAAVDNASAGPESSQAGAERLFRPTACRLAAKGSAAAR